MLVSMRSSKPASPSTSHAYQLGAYNGSMAARQSVLSSAFNGPSPFVSHQQTFMNGGGFSTTPVGGQRGIQQDNPRDFSFSLTTQAGFNGGAAAVHNPGTAGGSFAPRAVTVSDRNLSLIPDANGRLPASVVIFAASRPTANATVDEPADLTAVQRDRPDANGSLSGRGPGNEEDFH